MAEYPVIEPEPIDPLITLSDALVKAAFSALGDIALPPKRLDLELPARAVADELARRAT